MGFSPDGRTVVLANHGESEVHHAKFFDTRTGLAQGSFEIDNLYPRELAFSPDGRYFALSTVDGVKLIYLPRFIGGSLRVDAAALPVLWDDLNHPDVGVAYRAFWRMILAGPETAGFLRHKLRPVRAVPTEELPRLIQDLGQANYTIRHKAMLALERHGEAAGEALRKALSKNAPLETRRRIESLLANHVDVRRDRAVHILETVGSESARSLLEDIAKGLPDAQLTITAKASLQRLIRRTALP